MTTEPDILEALTELADAKVGGPMPKCLSAVFVQTGETLTSADGTTVGLASSNWGEALSEIARRAKEEIIDLRKACDIYEKMCRDKERRS